MQDPFNLNFCTFFRVPRVACGAHLPLLRGATSCFTMNGALVTTPWQLRALTASDFYNFERVILHRKGMFTISIGHMSE